MFTCDHFSHLPLPEFYTHGLPWWLSKKSACDVEDLASIPGLGRSPGKGNGNPLWHSCLGNCMDRGVWRGTVLGVAKRQTQLSHQQFHSPVLFNSNIASKSVKKKRKSDPSPAPLLIHPGNPLMTTDHAERRILSSPDIAAFCSRHGPWPVQEDGGQVFMPSPNPEETRTSFRVWRHSPSHHPPGRGRLLSKDRDNNRSGLTQPTQLFLFFLLSNLFIYSNWRHTCVIWNPFPLSSPPHPSWLLPSTESW